MNKRAGAAGSGTVAEPVRVRIGDAEVLFTNRTGGCSEKPFDGRNLGLFTADDRKAVLRNLADLETGIGLRRIALARQIHGADLVSVGEEDIAADSHRDPPAADGLITAETGVALLVTGADCPPVALAGRGRVAMLHCGWRPVAAGIIERAVGLFGDELTSEPTSRPTSRPTSGPITAAIGPGIGAGAYEVGPEVVAALGDPASAHWRNGRLDLQGLIAQRLEAAGVRVEYVAEHCTFQRRDLYFSHRRDGEPTGRQAGIAWLR